MKNLIMIFLFRSDKSATLYEHCVKAIEHGFRFGDHGLPLMGSGDWNDGMDKVGQHGKGESVWLAFFLYDILIRFIEVAKLKNDLAFAEKCKEQAELLQNNINAHAWDGEWYRRAYFDDGTPLGSSKMMNVKLIPLPKAGRYYPKRVNKPVRKSLCNQHQNILLKRKIRLYNCLILLLINLI